METHRSRLAGALIIATATLWAGAPAAHADTLYGGSGLAKGTSPSSPSVALLRRDDGSVSARAVVSARCRGWVSYSQVVRLTGRTDGVDFSAAGRARLGGRGPYVRVSLTGAFAPDAVSGTARVRTPCHNRSAALALRTASTPAGAPAVPAPGTLMHGFSSQSAGGFPLPVTLRVATNGRVIASWQALVRCGRGKLPVLDLTPSRPIRPDGSFGGEESYTIRYRGFSERYRVRFHGRFHADGATGTLRAWVQYRDGRHRYVPCRSGNQTWSARA